MKEITVKSKGYRRNRFLFDDCLICQALMQAEKEGRKLSSKETKDVFRKAAYQQTRVRRV